MSLIILPRGGPQIPASTISSYTTNFPATENPISQGNVWVRGGSEGLDWTDPQTTGGSPGAAWPTMPAFDGTNYNDSIAHLKNWVGNDHTVTGTVYDDGNPGNYEVELFTR